MGETGTADRTNRAGSGRRIDLTCVIDPHPTEPTHRTSAIALRFGLPLSGSPARVVAPVRLRVEPGQIAYVTGPSGSGKTTVVETIHREWTRACVVGRLRFPKGKAIVDAIAPRHSLPVAIDALTKAGMSDPQLWLRSFNELSKGEQFRAQLAKALGGSGCGHTQALLICDEFCEALHTRLARAISYQLRRLTSRAQLSVVVAGVRDDFLGDLQPDTVVRLDREGGARVTHREPDVHRLLSIRQRLSIQPGSKRDYEAFASMHYRKTETLGFVSSIFVLSDRTTDERLGIIVYGHSPLELALRNQATDRRFAGAPRRLNREMRILRRLVIHPDVRGCGLGRYLVRNTLARVGTRYVECLATMGAFNPVFERAGMTRIGTCALSSKRRQAVATLVDLGADPFDASFEKAVACDSSVRAIVTSVLADWYTATTAAGTARLMRHMPTTLAHLFRGLVATRPVYYLWQSRRRTRHASSTGIRLAA